jgi:phosphatidyl-myo-inositol alpha-mannosyltransferase
MNVAIASLFLPSRCKTSLGYQVHYFANKMVERGHSVTVFSRSANEEDAFYSLRAVHTPRNLEEFGFSWDLRRVDFSGFDVLHAHGNDWFLWGRELPRHVHTFHGAYFAEFLREPQTKEKLRLLALAVCQTASGALCDNAIAVSESTRSFLPGINRVIYNGLDLRVFTPGEKKSKAPVILFVGMLWGRKRGDLLVRIFREEILPTLPNAKLWMVCDEKVEGHGVLWFGRVCLRLLAQLYQKAWVLCSPGSNPSIGLSTIEAMASGTTVVATTNQGSTEATLSGRYGLLAKKEELGHTLLKALQDRTLRERFERSGIERARAFSWESVCAQYEEIYRGEAKGCGAPTAVRP